jgi:lysozyme
LREDYRELVLPVLEKYARVPLTIGQVIALADFIFNAGETNFRKSTLLRS